ncbi:putative Vta1 like [Trypanosoma vivax]|nr:putative Vta1 like [Trypanosoma vivax]
MSLLEEIPAAWAPTVRPFLQRAEEFQQRVPVVAYFLRTHAAYLALGLRSKGNSEGADFIRKLFGVLELEKQNLQEELNGVDGRTVLTQYALMLFSKADDEERSEGVTATANLAHLFFTASLLFEATAQFTEDGALDPIAAEKRNYARYVAVRIKKALDSGVPYVSINAGKRAASDCDEAPRSDGGLDSDGRTAGTPSLRESSQTQLLFSGVHTHLHQAPVDAPPPADDPPALASWTGGGGGDGDSSVISCPPPQQSFAHEYAAPPPPPPCTSPPPISGATAVSTNITTGYGCPSTKGPPMDAIIAAQKYAKEAVCALQFYDHSSARTLLARALERLNEKS